MKKLLFILGFILITISSNAQVQVGDIQFLGSITFDGQTITDATTGDTLLTLEGARLVFEPIVGTPADTAVVLYLPDGTRTTANFVDVTTNTSTLIKQGTVGSPPDIPVDNLFILTDTVTWNRYLGIDDGDSIQAGVLLNVDLTP
jgi:hypothetical protein